MTTPNENLNLVKDALIRRQVMQAFFSTEESKHKKNQKHTLTAQKHKDKNKQRKKNTLAKQARRFNRHK